MIRSPISAVKRQVVAAPALRFSTTISSKFNGSAELAVGDGVGETVDAAPPVAVAVGVPAWLVPVDSAVAVEVAGVPVTDGVAVAVAEPWARLVLVTCGLGVLEGVTGVAVAVATVALAVLVVVVTGLGSASSPIPALS